jgi:hypothetical protein
MKIYYCKVKENKGSDILTAVVIKNSAFWDITPHSLLTVNYVL